MTATPAQIANDMAAQAAWWRGRDRDIERVCHDAARVIRQLLAGQPVDGRTWGGLHGRLLRHEGRKGPGADIGFKLTRARLTLERLRREVGT